MEVFGKVATAMMSFNMMEIGKYQGELMELEQIDNVKEAAFVRLELLLKAYNQYQEISSVFVTTTTTTFNVGGIPQPVPVPVAVSVTPIPVPVPVQVQVAPVVATGLEERVVRLEAESLAIRAEFSAYRVSSEATIPALNTMMEAFKMQM